MLFIQFICKPSVSPPQKGRSNRSSSLAETALRETSRTYAGTSHCQSNTAFERTSEAVTSTLRASTRVIFPVRY